MNAFVLSDQYSSCKRLAANKTIVWFFTCMSPKVFLQGVSFDVRSAAYIAFIRFIDVMTFQVGLEQAVGKERFWAQFTLYCLFALVIATMLVQFSNSVKWFVTDLADAWFACWVSFRVLNETFVIDRDKTANITCERFFCGLSFLKHKIINIFYR